jgi:hypothetical protein
MKKIILSLFVAAFAFSATAQIKTPKPSPSQKIEQTVGLTDVTLEYSRPGMRGRTIFGDLVPFDKVWRTGANANTKITFSTDVTIDGKELKKGTYALYTIPNKETWDVIFYSDATNWGNPKNWDEAKVAAQVKTAVQPMPMKIETFTLSFDDLTNSSAVLGLLWENVYVGLKFETPTDALVSKQITATMSGPSAGDFYASATYYLESGKDIKKAQEWVDKAIEMTSKDPKFWMLRKQSLIHAKAGDKKGAIKAAKDSLRLAEIAKNAGYVKMNKASLKEWGAM